MVLPWVLCGVLSVAVIVIAVRLWFLDKAFEELRSGINDCLSEDTNTLIAISTKDRHARRFASELNRQLRLLRKQRLQYQAGDRELKEAITNISHDLRTPITAIRGYLDLLGQEDVPDSTRKYLAFIENRVEALRYLLDELFRYSVYASEPVCDTSSDVCLNSALEESVAEHYAVLKKQGIVPVIEMPQSNVVCRLDKAAATRIFGNILDNAAKYSDGDLEIELSELGVVRFSNTASELDEVQVGKLFNRFYTVNAARNGAGLGLAISKMLVERMGGNMSAQYVDNRLNIIVSFRVINDSA